MLAAKIGPQCRRDIDFRVGELPQEKIAEAHFAAGADKQIGVGIIAGIEVMIEDLLVDLGAVEMAEFDFADDGVNGFDDLDATTITEREDEDEPGVFARGLDAFVQLIADGAGQIGETTDGLEADVVFDELGQFVAEEAFEEAHQGVDFGLGPLPVLDGEGVKGEVLNAELAGGLDDVAHRFSARAMALDADHVLGLCPASVAVHDDGDVLGNFPKFVGGGGAHVFVATSEKEPPLVSGGYPGGYTEKVCSRCGPTETMRRRAPVKSESAFRYFCVAVGSFLKLRMPLVSFCQPVNFL
jgi:hypothetical protein